MLKLFGCDRNVGDVGSGVIHGHRPNPGIFPIRPNNGHRHFEAGPCPALN
jgi:hypothetical protein